jgi:hypothetical protein
MSFDGVRLQKVFEIQNLKALPPFFRMEATRLC